GNRPQIRQAVGKLHAALTMFLKWEGAGHQLVAVSRLQDFDLLGVHLPVAARQLGLGIEQVHLTGTAVLKEQNDGLRLRSEMPGARPQIQTGFRAGSTFCREQSVARQKMCESPGTQSECRLLQKRPPAGRAVKSTEMIRRSMFNVRCSMFRHHEPHGVYRNSLVLSSVWHR